MVDKVGIILSVLLHLTAVLLLGASISAGLVVLHVAVVPLIFRYCETFRRTIVFLNFVQWPLNINYEEPSSCGIEGARNIQIEFKSKVDNCPVRIGIWHILPKTVYERVQDKFKLVDKEELHRILDKELANSNTPVVFYCHGNSNSRAASHRILLYRFFQKMDYHTIAFDYRGYGDSTNLTPSEQGVVEDSLAVYDWLHHTIERNKDNNTSPSLFVWGHSLGTGISSNLLGNLDSLSKELLDRETSLPPPQGLILEAPFNNMADEVANYPLTRLAKWLPYYDYAFIAPFRESERFSFRSDQHLSRAQSLPILILHAKDDQVVPYVVGERLYRSIVSSRPSGAAVTLHSYPRTLNLGHKYICNADDLPTVVGDFVNSHR